MSESKDTRDVCKIMEKQGALVFAIVGGHLQEAGWPDRYVAPPGVWLEFKGKKGKPTPKQRYILHSLRLRDVPAYVARHVDGMVQLEWEDGTVLEVAPQERLLDVLKKM